MGEAESETPSRKRKQKLENPEESPEKKAKTFCCQTFRQEIKGSYALKSLKKFISAAKDSGDVIYEYIDNGGSSRELLSLLDPTASGDLTTALPVFEALHLMFLRFQPSDSSHHEKCIESARIILRSYLPVVKSMLSMNVTKQKKVALKLLTAIATLDSSFANEIMNVVALSPTLISALIQPTGEKESVRKCFILFVLSFLIEGNLNVLKCLLEKRGFLSSIIPGLKFDDATTVNMTLSLLEEKILKNVKIHKTLKLKIFNTQVIKSLFDLYDWKGPQGIKQIIPLKKNKAIKEVEINQNEKEIVTESVHSFLLLLCCSQKFGVAFYDKSMGTSDELNNQLLLTVFESLADPLKNKKVAEVMLKTIASCPDLMKPVLLKLEPFFQPRNSKNWFQAMEFAENLIKAMDPVGIIKKEAESVTPNQIIKVGKTLCAPVILLKIARSGSQKSQVVEIRFRSLTLLNAVWDEIQVLVTAFPNFENDLRKSLYKHIYKSLPDAEDLVELWHNLCNPEFFANLPLPKEKKILFLSSVLDTLHMITKCQKNTVSSPFALASDLLTCVDCIKESITQREFDDIQVKIVRFVETDFESLASNTELFEKSLSILFRSTEESSVSYLSRFLASLELFKRNAAEVDVWVLSYLSLPSEYRSSVADFLIRSIQLFYKKRAEDDEELKMDEGSAISLPCLLDNSIEIIKSYPSKSLKKDPNLQPIRHYLNDVILHLQHHYDFCLYDHLKEVKGLGKSILGYLKSWKENTTVEIDVFSCSLESDLVSWLINDEQLKSAENIQITNLLKRYSLFQLVVAFLCRKVVAEDLLRDDVDKFTKALSEFLNCGPENDRENVDLISFDVSNKGVYQRHCLDFLLKNKHLLNKFDVFQETGNDVSFIIFKVLMEEEIIRSLNVKKQLLEPWKCRFLKQLKTRLKNCKSVNGLLNLEKVLNFFEYDHSDVKDLIELFKSCSNLDLFIHKKKPSDWVIILSKFVNSHCQKEELDGVFVEKLCGIMEYLKKRCSEVEKLECCFVDLLRKHPSHLLLMRNDFLDVILLSPNPTTTTTTLGKLLLNDPSKVQHFLNFIKNNLDNLEQPRLIYPLVNGLIVEEECFCSNENSRSVWKMSEIDAASEIYNVLEMVYDKFKENIIQTAAGEKEEEFVIENIKLSRELIKLFLDKKEIKKLKKISKGKFEPELVYEAVKKFELDDFTENFVQGLLVLFCGIIKNSEELEEAVWESYYTIVSGAVELGKDSTWENVVVGAEWQKFTKLALGHCLSTSKCSPLIQILRLLITTFCKSNQSTDCGTIFQMLISHSQFLKLMFGNSPLKSELVALYRCLIEKSPSEMSGKHFPILLASYNASLSPADRTLLHILRFYEVNKIGVSSYEPFVWGDPAVSHYSIGTSTGLSLWQRFNMANVLELLDSQRMELSLKEFPIRRTLEGDQNVDSDSNVYDPAFVLPFFVNLLSPGAVVFCLPFIYKGGLAYTVRALSSECKEIRLLACVVLARFYNHLELSQKLKQKLVWMHFIDCFRFGIEDLSRKPLPNIITLFFARMTLELSSQPAEMYSPLQNFLLAKPYFSFDVVPEFLPLFHSSEVAHSKHRSWLLEVIRDGTKTPRDLNIIFHSMALKVIFCFFYSQLCDLETKKIILQAVEKMIRTDKFVLLISEYGLLNWIAGIDSFQAMLRDLLNLLHTLTEVVVKDIQSAKSTHTNHSHLIQILNVTVKILPSLKVVKSVEDFKLFLKIVNDCFTFFTKEGKSDWFKRNKNFIVELVDAGVVILGEDYDYGKYCKVPFYFRDFDEKGCYKELKHSIFMFNSLVNKQANEENIKVQL